MSAEYLSREFIKYMVLKLIAIFDGKRKYLWQNSRNIDMLAMLAILDRDPLTAVDYLLSLLWIYNIRTWIPNRSCNL